MFRDALHPHRKNQTWKYGLLGGLISIPLVLGDYWLGGMGDTFSVSMVLFGGLIAGYLAQRNDADAGGAATIAGMIGGLPGYIWILPSMIETGTSFAQAWSSFTAAAVMMVFFGVLILTFTALTGLIGGIIGSWLARKVHGKIGGRASA